MNRKKVDYVWLGISIISFLILAISFLLMPLGGTEDNSVYSMVAGIMFWVSIVIGISAQCVLSGRRKSWNKGHKNLKNKRSQRIGVISFFRNKYAVAADITAIVSLIGLVIALAATQAVGYICYVFISVFVFSLSMHCILNGKNFYYVVNQNNDSACR